MSGHSVDERMIQSYADIIEAAGRGSLWFEMITGFNKIWSSLKGQPNPEYNAK